MLHPVASSEYPAGAGGPSPMTEETSPPSDPIPSAVRIALEALGIKKIRETTTGTFVGKPHEGHTLLGQGGFSKVYQGKEAASNGIILGDIALAKSIAKTIPTDFIPLLNSVPQSPFILARPILVPGNKHVRLRMDLLGVVA